MVTQEQIAKKLGLSRQLVSFALSGHPHVGKSSREKILAAAKKMGYRPNPHARALKRGRTGIVALWVPDQISSHYSRVARELGRLVKTARHELIISEVGSQESEEILSHVPVDGIFAVDAAGPVEMYLNSPDAKAPVISIGAEFCDKTDYVRIDLATGTKELMSHLIVAGHKRIVHATFMHPVHPYAGRRAAYAEAMRKAGLKPEFFTYPLSAQQRSIVREGIKDYINRAGKPDAIFCHSDDVAMGIYRGLCELGLKVPDDVALAGCDGIQDTEYLERSLTTLVQPVAEMCETAWKFLENRLKRPGMKQQKVTLEPVLTVRESTVKRNR